MTEPTPQTQPIKYIGGNVAVPITVIGVVVLIVLFVSGIKTETQLNQVGIQTNTKEINRVETQISQELTDINEKLDSLIGAFPQDTIKKKQSSFEDDFYKDVFGVEQE